MPAHRDRRFRISIVARGQLRERSGGVEEEASTASVVVKPPGALHENQFGPGRSCLLSVEPSEGFVAGLSAEEQSVLGRWRWIHSGEVSAAAAGLLRAYVLWEESAPGEEDNSARECENLRGVWLEEAVLALFGALTRGGHERPAVGLPPAWLQRVRERLHEEFHRSLLVCDLAASANVHPTYLGRQFRRYYGTTPSRYRQRIRVKAAAHRLTSTDNSLARVALQAGFADQSHMCRLLKREWGLTPGQFREIVRRFVRSLADE